MAAASVDRRGATGSATRRRRKKRGSLRWTKTPRRPLSPAAGLLGPPAAAPPLPVGTPVEVRVDGAGFRGVWYEATVVSFAPARGPRTPARYKVTYAHLLDDADGGELAEHFAPTHVRPRPPPSSPPRQLRVHDIVEAFHHDGWWSGIVVSAPAVPDPRASVTVAFPLTREVIPFAPRLVRPRRDYVDGGGWVPSRAVVVVRPTRAVKVYQAGEKVEVRRDRDEYGYSWFPATIARVVDDLSYVVQYFDLEEEGDDVVEKATEYLHWSFIRPAVEHFPRESEFQLGPGAAVEAYCDGAWSPGFVLRQVGRGEYEISITGKKEGLAVTKVEELLKPLYKWNGKQWKIAIPKRRANLRRRSILGQNLSSPVDVSSSGDDCSHDPEPSGTKRSRKKLHQHDVVSAENSEHASVSEMDTPLSALCKSPESNHPGSRFSEKNSIQVTCHGAVSSAPMNGLVCASSGHSIPQNKSIPNSTGEIVDNQGILSEMMDFDVQLNTDVHGASAADSHDKLSIAELREKMVSARTNNAIQWTRKKVLAVKSLKVKKGISKSKGGKAHPIHELQGNNEVSDKIQLEGNINFSSNEIVCALSVSVEGQTTKIPDTWISRRTNRGSSTKVVAYKKLAKRRRPRDLCSPHSSVDVTCTVQQTGRKKVAGPIQESPLSEQLDKTSEDTLNTTDLSDQDLLPMVPPGFESTFDGRGTIHGSVLDDEPTAMVNSISQVNINADVCTNHATMHRAKRNHLTETDILSADHPIQEAGRKVDERSIRPCLQNAGSSRSTMNNSPLRSCSLSGSSMPSLFSVSQGDQALFVKSSPMWQFIEESDVFKEVRQRPHFLPLREFSPDLREGMALGLMVSFADLVKNTREARIDYSVEWFEGKLSSLCHLERNGFDVQFLQSTLNKLLHIKSNGYRCLGELNKLKGQIVGIDASSPVMNALLGEKDRAIAELEQKLGRLRQESQKIARDIERRDEERCRLQASYSRFEEAYADANQDFNNVLAELHRKQLT